MKIVELSPEEYREYLTSAGVGYNFMQSPEFYQAQSRHEETIALAGIEDGEIQYAVLVFFRPAMKLMKYADSLVEWIARSPEAMRDEEKLSEFIAKAGQELKNRGAIVWFVESKVEYQQHDKDGNVLEHSFHNEDYRQMLERAGLTPLPLWQGYDLSRQHRWVSWLDLQKGFDDAAKGYPYPLENSLEQYTWPELLKEMSGNTRRSFQKTDLPYIEVDLVRGNEPFDLSEFETLLETSAEKHSFGAGNLEHKKDLLECFGEKGYLCTSYLNTDAYEQYLEEKENELKAKEEAAKQVLEKMPNSRKKQNQLKEIQEALGHNEKEKQELSALIAKEGRRRIALASGIFLETPSEMVYLFGGSRPDLARYMGPYANQKVMIRLALEHKLQRYNFWGISGYFKPEEEGYGVYFFKKNLGATVGEYSGEFVRVLSRLPGNLFLKKVR